MGNREATEKPPGNWGLQEQQHGSHFISRPKFECLCLLPPQTSSPLELGNMGQWFVVKVVLGKSLGIILLFWGGDNDTSLVPKQSITIVALIPFISILFT